MKTAIQTMSGAGLRPERISETAIWTYERADGRRLAIPFSTADAPDGHMQTDIVFGERVPLPPEVLRLPGIDQPLLAAPAALALAWKLLWLATDTYPQGKDLYDAVLLAEHTPPRLDLTIPTWSAVVYVAFVVDV
ncbi:MAG TPA: nucleotidyl transferase AbiEii/AbiGii toxin family protein [Micromonosporaceae bacterium]